MKNPEELGVASLGQKLRAIRLAVGFSQQNVADRLNVNRSTYTYYETGKTTPDPMTLYHLSKIFAVPVEIFFEEERSTPMAQDPEKKRSPKKVELDPEKVGQLSSGEKDIVAYLRDKELPCDAILQALKERFG